jgi:hypothetical protein
MILWGLNPIANDAPPLEFTLMLDKVLPLTRANYFLNSITSFAGLIKHFNRPGLTLYYTLTRAGSSLHERVLYITIFDHTERTARVLTRVGTVDGFYSATVPVVDLEHGLLETQLGEKINSNDDPIAGDGDVRTLLVDHYQSLLHAMNRHAGNNYDYRIGDAWTMNAFDVIPAPDERAGRGDQGGYCLERDVPYFEQGRFERMQQSLDEKRGRWVEHYMRLVIAETRDFFEGQKTLIRKVDGVLADETMVKGKGVTATGEERANMESDGKTADNDEESRIVERALIPERARMEMLLVYEVDEWEGKLRNVTREFIRREDVQEKERVERERKANCWKRLDANIRAMDARMKAAKENAKGASNDFSEEWQKAHEYITALFITLRNPEKINLSLLFVWDPRQLDLAGVI